MIESKIDSEIQKNEIVAVADVLETKAIRFCVSTGPKHWIINLFEGKKFQP